MYRCAGGSVLDLKQAGVAVLPREGLGPDLKIRVVGGLGVVGMGVGQVVEGLACRLGAMGRAVRC